MKNIYTPPRAFDIMEHVAMGWLFAMKAPLIHLVQSAAEPCSAESGTASKPGMISPVWSSLQKFEFLDGKDGKSEPVKITYDRG